MVLLCAAATSACWSLYRSGAWYSASFVATTGYAAVVGETYHPPIALLVSPHREILLEFDIHASPAPNQFIYLTQPFLAPPDWLTAAAQGWTAGCRARR